MVAPTAFAPIAARDGVEAARANSEAMTSREGSRRLRRVRQKSVDCG